MNNDVRTLQVFFQIASMLPTALQHIASLALAQHEAVQSSAHAAAGHADVIHGPSWILAIVLLPFAAFLLNGLSAALKIKNKLPAWLTVASLAVSFALTLTLFFNHFTGDHHPIVTAHGVEWISFKWGTTDAQTFTSNFAFYIDSLTCLWMLFVTGLATLIALYASEYMSHDVGLGYCRFFAAFSLFVFSMLNLVMADNLLLLFLGWEGVGLCSYLLIGYFYKKPEAVAAAKKAFIMNRIGDLGLLMALFSTYAVFGTIEYSKIFAMIQTGYDAAGNPLVASTWVTIVMPLLFTAGAFGKSAQLFFYVWLPDAMEGPTPVSALIHAATMVTAGVFLIARMFPLYTIDPHTTILTVVSWSGGITAFWAATIGMAHFDIKRIMGYSTVSQLGYMFAGLGVMTSTGAAFHVFTHAFFKATLFLACGAVMHGFAGQLDLRKLSGVRKMKGWGIVAFAMLIGAINLAGVPLTAGFWSKDMILAEAFVKSPVLGWLLLLTAGLTAYYTFRAYFRVFEGPVEYHPGPDLHAHDHADDHGHDHGHDHAHAPAATAAKHDDHAHDHFHPHAPDWAINTVLVLLMLGCFAIIPLAFMGGAEGGHGGWVGAMVHSSSAAALPQSPTGEHAAHGTFLGMDPHKVMYYVSGVVGALGIIVAFVLHLLGRTSAAHSRADSINLGPLTTGARAKWYVDEIYDALIVKPLYVLSHIFHLIDQYIVDGIVNLFGAIPRMFGKLIRPTQSGEVHGYALGMAGGLAVILVLVFLLAK
ncbi:MAG: NADH-quinone oxidoreductase subunit L [Phycisphaerales bacterium]